MEPLASIGRAFVTGATGFLGYAIAQQLAELGVEVTALSRNGGLPGDLLERGVTSARGDLDDTDELAHAMEGADVVFHVAADVGMWRSRFATSHRVNVLGTRHVVDASLRTQVKRLVFTSSASTIGKPLKPHDGVVTLDETSLYNLEPLGMVYPHTKWLAEQEVLRGIEGGLSAVITHPAAILGPGDWKLNLLPLFRAPRSALGVAVPRGHRTVCDVRDVARAHIVAASRAPSGERYILGGEGLSIRDLFTRIATHVGGRPPLFTLPDRAVRGVGALTESIADWRGQPPLLSWEMALQSTLRVRLCSAKAERELGYVSRPLDESLRDAVAWYRVQGVLSQ